MTPSRVNVFSHWLTAVLACAFASAVMVLLLATPAAPATGTAGPIAVSVTPSDGLHDGQTVAIHAQAAAGSDLFEIKAHLCVGDVAITDTYNFGFDGPYCPKFPVSANSDAETSVEIPAGSGGKGDLNFRVGEGTGPTWADFDGALHTLTCGPDAHCQLVVQLQVPHNTVFYSVPLCFGSCPGAPAAEPPPAAPAAANDAPGSSGSATAGQSADAASPGGSEASPAGAAASPAADNGTPPAAGSDPSAPAAAAGSTAQDAALSSAGAPASAVSEHALSPTARVFASGAAGLIGGALIVLIVVRARRRMLAEAVS